jgi:hypothetical protein
VLLVAAAVGAFLVLRRPAPRTPEERIRAALDAAARAAGERKADEVVELLSPRFQGEAGGERFTRDDARRLVALELLRGRWVSAAITGVAPAVEGTRARATVHAVLSRSDDRSKGLSSLLPGEASAHRFQLDLEEEDGEWRVVSAGWRQISLDEALSGPPAPDW